MGVPGAGAGTYEWTGWGHAGNPVNLQNVGQQWYRNPAWGGHVVWNPKYGYQDYVTIEKMYANAQSPMGAQQFDQAMSSLGLTPNLEGTWGTYFGNDPAHRRVSHQEKMMHQYGVPYNPYGAGAQQMNQPQYGGVTQPYGGYQQPYSSQTSGGAYAPIDTNVTPFSPTAQTQPVKQVQQVQTPQVQVSKAPTQNYARPRNDLGFRGNSRESTWWR